MMTSSCFHFAYWREPRRARGTGAVGAGKRCDGGRPDLRWNAAGAQSHTLAITLDVPEDTDIYMPMVSRLAQ